MDLKHFLAKKYSEWNQILMARWKRKSTVNCWFCNEDSIIELHKENAGWGCPCCHQYNGFKEDGDYDCEIPEQYENSVSKVDKAYCQRENVVVPESILCRLCQQNQALKVGQLASFVPLSESSFNEEVDVYSRYLESVYSLCQCCKEKVQIYLTRQDDDIFKTLDEDSLKIQETGLLDSASLDTKVVPGARSFQSWITFSFFFLCLLMAMTNVLFSIRICLEHERRRLSILLPSHVQTVVLYISSTISVPTVQRMLQLPVYFGAGLCLLGLLAVGKKCVYIIDAVHIVHWLALLVVNVLSPSSSHDTLTAVSYLILCLSTTSVCFICLTMFRHPRMLWQFASQWNDTERKQTAQTEESICVTKRNREQESKTARSILPLLADPSPPSSPVLHDVGEAKNFFKPILSSATSSPTSFSSPSPSSFSNQEKLKNTYDVVRDGLESFSLGLTKKSGSTSSIWSLPSVISSDLPSSPDSTLPTSTATANNSSNNNRSMMDPVARNILSPSRLGFLSFSLSPSPGKFSPSIPTSDPDSGFSPDLSDKCDSQIVDSSSGKSDKTPPSLVKATSPLSRSTSTPSKQTQSFTKYRDESKRFSVKPKKLDKQFLSSAKDKNNKAMAPDSTSNDMVGKQVRRSNRIAMRGKIIRPWPLKKSLSVNNMYDSPNDVDFFKKGMNKDPPVAVNEKKMQTQTTTQLSRVYPSVRNVSQKSHGYMDKIAEFSDDEDVDSPSCNKRVGRLVMRGETEKESKWPWTLLGMVIGVSVTVNVFLVMNMWMGSSAS